MVPKWLIIWRLVFNLRIPMDHIDPPAATKERAQNWPDPMCTSPSIPKVRSPGRRQSGQIWEINGIYREIHGDQWNIWKIQWNLLGLLGIVQNEVNENQWTSNKNRENQWNLRGFNGVAMTCCMTIRVCYEVYAGVLGNLGTTKISLESTRVFIGSLCGSNMI